MYCKTSDTPQWRRGPDGTKSYVHFFCMFSGIVGLTHHNEACAMHVVCIITG